MIKKAVLLFNGSKFNYFFFKLIFLFLFLTGYNFCEYSNAAQTGPNIEYSGSLFPSILSTYFFILFAHFNTIRCIETLWRHNHESLWQVNPSDNQTKSTLSKWCSFDFSTNLNHFLIWVKQIILSIWISFLFSLA